MTLLSSTASLTMRAGTCSLTAACQAGMVTEPPREIQRMEMISSTGSR